MLIDVSVDCYGVYIGEIGRKRIFRVSEQLLAWFSSFGKSASTDHLIAGHRYKREGQPFSYITKMVLKDGMRLKK